MSGADTSLDGALARLAAFYSRCASRSAGSGVVAQLVEHHNGIVSGQSGSTSCHLPYGRKYMSPRSSVPVLERSSFAQISTRTSYGNMAIGAAIGHLVERKTAARRRKNYVSSLRQYLGAFARGREGVPLSSIGPRDIESWFDARNEPPSGRASNLGRLSALFSHGIRQGWIDRNPCDLVERITIEHRPPAILSVGDCERLLSAAGPDLRPWVVLGLFAGLRPTEAERLQWGAVRLTGPRPHVVVDAAASKVRRRRIVPLQPTAVAWLALDARPDGAVVSSYSTLRRRRREAARAAGVRWSQDVLRHTCGSMRLAAGAHTSEVADEMGNSPRILRTHYAELVTREDAERFWAIRPCLSLCSP